MTVANYVGAAITPVRIRKIYDPQRGWQLAKIYTGTPGQIDTVVAATTSDQRLEREERGDGMDDLVVTTPDSTDAETSEEQQDTWELLNNRVEKDLYEHPNSKAISADNIKAIRKFLKKPIEGADPAFDGLGTTSEAQTLFGLLLKGTNKYTTGEYALRYRIAVSTRSAVVASFSNVWKLHSDAQLEASVTIPSEIGFSIGGIPDPPTIPTGYAFKWLKIAPTVTKQNGKTVISQEWWLDLWSTWIYLQVP